MPRRPRIDAADVTHHIVNRGVDRQQIFFADRDRIRFGQLLAEANERFGISLLAYCLMDNHLHLMAHCPGPVLSESMQFLNSGYAQYVNQEYGRVGHLFGARFWSAPLDTSRYKLFALRYIERNSLALPGIAAPDAYRWSSVRSHLGYRKGPSWLDSDTVRSWFSTTEGYRRFIAHDAREIEPVVVDLDHLDAVVSLMIDSHVDPDLATTRMARTVAVGLSQTLGERNEARVLDRLGLVAPKSVREAVRRYEQRSAQEPSIIGAVDATRRWLFDLGEAAPPVAA